MHLPLIGLTGRKRCGKNTVANILAAEYGYRPAAFADALKDDIYSALLVDPCIFDRDSVGLRNRFPSRTSWRLYLEPLKDDGTRPLLDAAPIGYAPSANAVWGLYGALESLYGAHMRVHDMSLLAWKGLCRRHSADRTHWLTRLLYIWERCLPMREGRADVNWMWPLLQLWGTELVRRTLCYDDYWIDQAPLVDGVALADCRFPNEAAAVRRGGGRVIAVVNPRQEESDAHDSERSIDLIEPDGAIINNGTLDDLRHAVLMLGRHTILQEVS